MSDPRFEHDRFVVRQLIRPMVNVYEVSTAGADGKSPETPIAFVRQKRLRLKEEIRFFGDQSQTELLFSLQARRVIEIGGHYDVVGPDGKIIGTLHKKARESFLRSTWQLLDPNGAEISWVQEKSASIAVFRRIKDLIPYGELIPIPYHFTFYLDQTPAGEYRRILGLRDRYLLDLSADAGKRVDRRLAVALAIALDALQAR
ncbi:MAG: hypothetical protein M3238_07920 [Actinomycetota bacterium]|nr:hypothetical protein [Actinomycetota bacterium]